MKKSLLSLALIAISMMTVSSVAQTTCPAGCKAETKECVKSDKDCKAACNGCPKQAEEKKMSAHKGRHNPFEGMNLTDQQKDQLKQLNTSRRAARKAKAEKAKENRMQNDSIRNADRKEYLRQVKTIIGDDNYKIYLENIATNAKHEKTGHHRGYKTAGHHRNATK